MNIETLKLALEALENNRQTHHYCEDTWYSCPKHEDGCANESEGDECNCGADKANGEIDKAITAIKEALAQSEQEPVAYSYTSRITGAQGFSHHPMPRFVDSESWDIKPLYTQQYRYIAPTHQKPFGWKLVPIEPTNEMLKAMDECSTEGYDERLLAGHASSVYMAAVDVAPTPPQPEQAPVATDWSAVHEKLELVWYRELSADEGLDEVQDLINTTPPQRKPLTVDAVWQNDQLMSLNAQLGCGMDLLMEVVEAIEAAHGIKGEA